MNWLAFFSKESIEAIVASAVISEVLTESTVFQTTWPEELFEKSIVKLSVPSPPWTLSVLNLLTLTKMLSSPDPVSIISFPVPPLTVSLPAPVIKTSLGVTTAIPIISLVVIKLFLSRSLPLPVFNNNLSIPLMVLPLTILLLAGSFSQIILFVELLQFAYKVSAPSFPL